jgi:hypothetical protein
MSHGPRRPVQLAALAAVGASCLTVAGCGLIHSAAAGGASGASASASSTPDPLASLSANKIATEAMANLKAAASLTMDGNLVDSGQAYTVKVGIKPGKGCAGSIDMGSKGSFKIIVIGKTVYINPDDTFWKADAGSDATAALQLVDGRYIKTTASGSLGSVTELCDLSQALGSIKVTGTMTKGKLTTLNGVRVLPLTQAGDGTLWVTDTAKPEVVKMVAPKGSDGTSGTLTFSPGAPVTLTAPPASDVLAGSAVGL